MSSNVIFLCVQSLEKVSIQFLANKLALMSCSFKTTLIINASTWPFYSFFLLCIFIFTELLSSQEWFFPRRRHRVLYQIALNYDICLSFLFIYIFWYPVECSVIFEYHIAWKKTNFICYQYSASSAVGDSTICMSLIYISTIHVADACNQMKWPIKQYHQGIGVPLFLERY